MDLNYELISLNVRGMREYKKCRKMLNWLFKHGGESGISFLQETHGTPEIENQWKHRFRGEIIFSHGSSHSRGPYRT